MNFMDYDLIIIELILKKDREIESWCKVYAENSRNMIKNTINNQRIGEILYKTSILRGV